MKGQGLIEPAPIENECKEDETGVIGAQRLMFTGYWELDLKTDKYG
jgi:hypothetical protein